MKTQAGEVLYYRNEDNYEILIKTVQDFLYFISNYNFYNVGYEFRIVFEL